MANRRRGRTKVRRAAHELSGIVRVSGSGKASVETAEGSFNVARGGLREAMPGDEVVVSLSFAHGSGRVARVRSVTHRAITDIVGIYSVLGPLGCVTPLDTRISCEFYVLPEDVTVRELGVVSGDVVRAQIVEYPTRTSEAVVTLMRRLGSPEELDLGVESVIASRGLDTEFSAAALAEAKACSLNVDEALADEGRRDLRGLLAVTIDPADARDYDDAVGCLKTPDGGFELWVHIADVSHYVAWESSIDICAKQRTCSVYLADRVLPMLPDELCCDLCSLRPNVDRLAMSVRMLLDAKGHVLEAEATPSVIRSAARLTYGQVDAALSGERLPDGTPPEVGPLLSTLNELRELRQAVRAKRGSIGFDSREARVRLDEAGHPIGVEIREETEATGLVEEAMLLANECVAKMLDEAGVITAFRVHERPSPDSLRECVGQLRELGVLEADEAEPLVAGNPYITARVLERAKGTSRAQAANALLLRAQKRAVYLPRCDGHYALGARAYCHFTSPIRRYPDLLVHRALKALLAGKLDTPCMRAMREALPQLCFACSEGERVADAAARDSQKVKMAEYLAPRVGERFAGVVSGVAAHGIYVTLDATLAEGLLPARLLEDSHRDDELQSKWQLGRRVAVKLESTDPLRGWITFGPV